MTHTSKQESTSFKSYSSCVDRWLEDLGSIAGSATDKLY